MCVSLEDGVVRCADVLVSFIGSWCLFQDQFENLEKHTSWGIDFLERYTKFVKERADIELSYAKQIR